MTTPWPNPPQIPPGGPTVFPAVAPVAVDEHPVACPCLPCIDALLVRLARPLVPVGALTDRALAGRTDSPTAVGAITSPLAFGVGAGGDLQGAAGWDGPAAPARGCAW